MVVSVLRGEPEATSPCTHNSLETVCQSEWLHDRSADVTRVSSDYKCFGQLHMKSLFLLQCFARVSFIYSLEFLLGQIDVFWVKLTQDLPTQQHLICMSAHSEPCLVSVYAVPAVRSLFGEQLSCNSAIGAALPCQCVCSTCCQESLQ